MLTVDETVAKLAASMEENPWTRHAPTIRDIVEYVRRAYGDDAARQLRITVH